MPSYHFVGLVHPQGGGWFLDAPVGFQNDASKIQVIIRQSTFQAFVDTVSTDDVGTVWNHTASVVRGVLDSIGFHRAAALSIELTGGSMDGQHLIAFDYVWNEIAETKSPRIEGDALGAYALTAASNSLVRYALADLRSALESPDDTGFYCYRAIESIRHNYTEESDKSDGDSWKRLREDLDVSRSEIEGFKALADDRRHGRQLHAVSEDERRSALLTARKIVKRFVYRENRDSW
ncbi:hypothetical protein [Nocardia jiangsuensis]|uniref:DUF8168 domain-containing protein n=1 Tax=Nocardia jiangsuensis TaxID=1691563 RepID=A0ABV8DVW9_9NOCA